MAWLASHEMQAASARHSVMNNMATSAWEVASEWFAYNAYIAYRAHMARSAISDFRYDRRVAGRGFVLRMHPNGRISSRKADLGRAYGGVALPQLKSTSAILDDRPDRHRTPVSSASGIHLGRSKASDGRGFAVAATSVMQRRCSSITATDGTHRHGVPKHFVLPASCIAG